ncbi:sensor histidine kinase [Streptomyces sp. NPDC058045]|uniref:sensor histidine kinase n=1 Tax=Streptomyces sp. NPDC058045 TaxID=3346311 RepID=UPI0036E534F7
MSGGTDGTRGAAEVPLSMGGPPRNRRAERSRLLWIGIWLAFLADPVHEQLDGRHSTTGTVLGWIGLTAFVGSYFVLVFRHMSRPVERHLVWTVLALLLALALLLSLTLGEAWRTLFVYLSVACGATLPLATARWTIVAVTAVMVAAGLPGGSAFELGLVVPALLGGLAMTGVRQLVMVTVELRRARATVAQLAANEERLRLARDLHDLLGHSLSLITLKSELAGRMLPGQPEKAAEQVADIERVSRQALVDVREAVTGYRRPQLSGELAGAQVALTAAGITAEVPQVQDGGPELPEGLTGERESALAWALREAVTNVVRHSGARRCTVTLGARQTLDGGHLELAVTDDGTAGPTTPGNGLTGLAERLDAVGGALEAGAARGGFRLVARVPLPPPTAREDGTGDTVGSAV